METYRQVFYDRYTGAAHGVAIRFEYTQGRRYTVTVDGKKAGCYHSQGIALDRVAEILRVTGWSPTPTV